MTSSVFFRCCDATTPLKRLQARHRWATWTIVGWLASGVATAEGLASIVMFGASTAGLISTCIFCLISLLLAAPALALLPVVGELERELRSRSALEPTYVPMEERLPRFTLRMITWFSAAVVLPNVVAAYL